MSDGTVTIICAAIVQIALAFIGFATLWLKLKYGIERADEAAQKASVTASKVEKVESKIDTVQDMVDHNTTITTAAKDAAARASVHTETCDKERTELLISLKEHEGRIANLEGQMTALRTSVDAVKSDVTSTRHEMRGHLQSITNKLDLISMTAAQAQQVAPAPQPKTNG